ncbi:DUF1934 domain-containing protein [Radiobacillus sp. PE A8.2]|uniref:DUF1934 domain-containing protein n=1 Tax=Radiobacillus sp. PE A8.2 TaxID=3380349 RepID=UPI00388EC186
MGVYKIPVKIKLVSEIREKGQKMETIVEESGKYFRHGEKNVLTFTEHGEDQDVIDSLVTIQADKVSVKRSGSVDMHQVFKKKQTTENVYRHTYGTILMETYTDQITYQQLTEGKTGKLFISYKTKLNGESERRHRLTLTFKERA